MENPIKMDDLGGKPTILGNTQMVHKHQTKKTIQMVLWGDPDWKGKPFANSSMGWVLLEKWRLFGWRPKQKTLEGIEFPQKLQIA